MRRIDFVFVVGFLVTDFPFCGAGISMVGIFFFSRKTESGAVVKPENSAIDHYFLV